MNNKGIRSKVLLHVEANPNVKRAEIMAALNLDALQVSNALGYWRATKQLFASGRGCATTWTAERPKEKAPEPKTPTAHPLMSALYR